MARTNGSAADAEQGDPAVSAAARLFAGPGELRALCRALDWAATPLGPVEEWPAGLQAAARLCLDAGFATCLYAGPELVLVYNDRFVEALGRKHPAALGRPAREVWAEVWAQVAPDFARVRATGAAVFHHDQRFLLNRGADGAAEEAFFTFAFSPVRDERGAVVGVFNTATDTTARVRAEAALAAERERLRSVILHMPSPVALLEGPEHRFTLVNSAFRRVSGGGRDVTGLTPPEAFPELAGSGLFELHDRVYATGEPWVGPETLVRYDRDGTGVEDTWFDLRFEPVRDGAGRVVAILNFAVDVTEQVLARRQVERLLAVSEAARAEAEAARAEAEAASRAKSEFLAVMSHELRTPLNAIGGYAELMEMGIRGPVTAQQREDLGRIQRSQRHLLGLVNEVLNYAKLESGAVRYDPADVVLCEALAAAEGLIAPQARAKGLALAAAECPADLAVRADPEKLRQVLVNLLSNAVKFTDRGGRITVACAADGPRVRIAVRDTGIGIPAEQIERVFEPFVQVRADLTRTAEGTGLGLAISRDLARGMGGELTAESTPGAGSTFTLTLPRA